MIILLYEIFGNRIRVANNTITVWMIFIPVYIWLQRGRSLFEWTDLWFYIPLIIIGMGGLVSPYSYLKNYIITLINKKLLKRRFIFTGIHTLSFSNKNSRLPSRAFGVICGDTVYIDDDTRWNYSSHLRKFYDIKYMPNMYEFIKNIDNIDEIEKKLVAYRLEVAT